MYKRSQQGWLKHLDFIILDLICLTISFMLSYRIRQGSIVTLIHSQLYTNIWLAMILFDLLIMLLAGTMHNVVRRGYFKEFTTTLKQGLFLFGLVSIYLFTVKDGDTVSRIILWFTFLLHILITYIVRLAWKKVLYNRYSKEEGHSVLLVADWDKVGGVLRRLKESPLDNLKVTGIVIADRDASGSSVEGIPVVCNIEETPKYICHKWIEEVYISTSVPPLELFERCAEMGVTTHRELHYEGSDRQFVERIAGAHVITNTMNVATPAQMFIKRTMDIAGGIVGSIFALIIMAIVGPKIKKASPGPILFKQDRVGQNGKHFKMYKIRSMHMDAEARKEELMSRNRVSDGMMFKLDFDPRIIGNEILPDGTHKTGIGEFIRNTSLDEFPQFFNVLLGQMSMVGTRPPTLDEWEKYEYHHRARLAIKPGLTGMWQVNGRSKVTDFEEVVKLDTQYINNWTLGLDIKILFQTIIGVIKRDGAM